MLKKKIQAAIAISCMVFIAGCGDNNLGGYTVKVDHYNQNIDVAIKAFIEAKENPNETTMGIPNREMARSYLHTIVQNAVEVGKANEGFIFRGIAKKWLAANPLDLNLNVQLVQQLTDQKKKLYIHQDVKIEKNKYSWEQVQGALNEISANYEARWLVEDNPKLAEMQDPGVKEQNEATFKENVKIIQDANRGNELKIFEEKLLAVRNCRGKEHCKLKADWERMQAYSGILNGLPNKEKL